MRRRAAARCGDGRAGADDHRQGDRDEDERSGCESCHVAPLFEAGIESGASKEQVRLL
jgi:hypothetical protein